MLYLSSLKDPPACPELVRLLLEYGANFERKDFQFNETVLQRGLQVFDYPNNYRETSTECIYILLEAGSDLSIAQVDKFFDKIKNSICEK